MVGQAVSLAALQAVGRRRVGGTRPVAGRSLRPAGRNRTLVARAAGLEGGPASVKELTLVATLAGIAAAGRVLFAPIPKVQPVTVIAAAAGSRSGYGAGSRSAAWQRSRRTSSSVRGYTRPGRCSHGVCGAAARLAAADPRPAGVQPSCFALGFVYGGLMDLSGLVRLPAAQCCLAGGRRGCGRCLPRSARDRERGHRRGCRAGVTAGARAVRTTAETRDSVGPRLGDA